MKYAYDFHIHSCLSPCGDEEMTPYNLVNLAKLWGLDIIALTDHNSCGNCRAAIEAGLAADIAVIPGMELCTAEEIHMVCLFPDIASAEGFAAAVRETLPPIQNRPKVFGEQLLMDSGEQVLGCEPLLLTAASGVPINDAPGLAERFGGFCYPAHIDRASYSILSSLGEFPPEPRFACAEITAAGDIPALCAAHPVLRHMRVMRSSDAHRLSDMHAAADMIELPGRTAQAALTYLRGLL